MKLVNVGVALGVVASSLALAPSAVGAQEAWSGFSATTLQATNSHGQNVARPTWGLAVLENGSGYQVVNNNHALASGIWTGLGTNSPSYSATDFTNAVLAGVTKHIHDTHGIRVADFDNDGDQDFIEYVGDACGELDEGETDCVGDRPGTGYNRYWENDGDGTFTFVADNGTAQPFLRARGGAPFDFDLDGDLDILAGGVHDSDVPDNQRPVILENDIATGDYTVADGSESLVYYTHAGVVSNWGPGTSSELILNNAQTFGRRFLAAGSNTVAATDSQERTSASDIRDWVMGDFDGDLEPEVFLVRDSRTDANGLQLMLLDLTQGSSSVQMTIPTSVTDCAVGAAGDFDNDGDLDLFLGCSGSDDASNHFLLNDGSGTFSVADAKVPAPVQVDGAAATAENAVTFDANGDGFLDIYIGNGFETAQESDQLLINQATGNDYLQIDLVGTTDNADAVGAAVYVGSATEGWQVRQVGHTFHKGSDAMTMHFGLGDDDVVAPIIVTWPNGTVEQFASVSSNARISLVQGEGTAASISVVNSAPVIPSDPDPDPDPGPSTSTAGPAVDQIKRLYNAALNRTNDPDGEAFWLGRYQAGSSLAEIAAGFMGEPEFASIYGANPTAAELVDKLYDNVLGRPAEEAGRNFWIGEITSGNRTMAEVIVGISESPENIAATNTSNPLTSAESKVYRLYNALLDREAEGAGLAYWTGRYQAGMSLKQMAVAFTAEAEFIADYGTSLTNDELVEALYQNVFDRAPEAAGRAYWLSELSSGARDQYDVMVAFSESDENLRRTGTAP